MKRPYVLMAEENIVAEGSPNPACPPGAMIQNSLIQGGEAPKNLPIANNGNWLYSESSKA